MRLPAAQLTSLPVSSRAASCCRVYHLLIMRRRRSLVFYEGLSTSTASPNDDIITNDLMSVCPGNLNAATVQFLEVPLCQSSRNHNLIHASSLQPSIRCPAQAQAHKRTPSPSAPSEECPHHHPPPLPPAAASSVPPACCCSPSRICPGRACSLGLQCLQ